MADYLTSRKSDAMPILSSGCKEIGLWQLDHYFYNSFTNGTVDSSRRLFLVRKLAAYLSELKKFGLQLEIWIDGSFTTVKPDPEDIDLVVWAYQHELEGLALIRQPAFERLTVDRGFVMAKYNIDVYLAFFDDQQANEKWTTLFTQGHYTYSQKGFFKLVLPHV